MKYRPKNPYKDWMKQKLVLWKTKQDWQTNCKSDWNDEEKDTN
jgi:hypothetical protein